MEREAERKEAERRASLEYRRVCESVRICTGEFEHGSEGDDDFAVEALGGEAVDGGIERLCGGGCSC